MLARTLKCRIRQPTSSSTKKIGTRESAGMFLEKVQELNRQPHAKDEKKRHSVEKVGTIDKIHGHGKVRHVLGPSIRR